ncbi:MAG: hypothetical protein DRH17_11275 [Deltaproteobacteria bacterium]|nr:MAG: hypothetical protein DRH17_11275 [Deltaproteobacteria bacterium]
MVLLCLQGIKGDLFKGRSTPILLVTGKLSRATKTGDQPGGADRSALVAPAEPYAIGVPIRPYQ